MPNNPDDDSKNLNTQANFPQNFVNNPGRHIKKPFIFGLVIILVISIGFYFYNNQKTNLPNVKIGMPTRNSGSVTLDQNLRWMNCADMRDVIEEKDRLYIACLGGVLVVDKEGKVIDQITMADGLGNQTAT